MKDERDRDHVILRREDAEGPQDARLSHFEVLRRALPAQDDVSMITLIVHRSSFASVL